MDTQHANNGGTSANLGKSIAKPKKFLANRKLSVGVTAVLVLIIGLAVAITLRSSRDPQLLVNDEPYAYACSAFTQNDLTNAFGAERSEYEFIKEELSLNVADGGEPVDILTLTSQDSIESKCTYGLNVQDDARGEASSNLFEATITQYRDNETARAAAESDRPEQAKKLPSFTGREAYFVYTTPSPEQLTIRPVGEASIVHGNSVIYAKFTSLDQLDENSLLSGLDEILTGAVARLDGAASEPTDFSGTYEYSGRDNTDVCKAVNIGEIADSMGPISLKSTKIQDIMVSAVRSEEASEKVLQSVCVLGFRTSQDQAAQEGKEITGNGEGSAYDRRFPHDLTLLVTAYDTADTAKGAITKIRKDLEQETGGPRPVPVRLGDSALKFRRDNAVTGKSANYYYIQQGQMVYHLNVTSTVQKQPYATELFNLNDEMAGKIFDQLSSAAQ